MTAAANDLPVTAVDPILSAIGAGVVVYDLAQALENNMPCSPNHPGFRMALLRRHGDFALPGGGSAANEMIVTGGHVGTHIDALAHASRNGLLHDGVDAGEAQRGGRFSVHGSECIPPMVCRGVLLDVAALHGVPTLPAGYGITDEDLERASRSAGVRPEKGDVCLVRTGWARHWRDAPVYVANGDGVPGVALSGARWLAERGVRAAGADTTAFEQIVSGNGHRVMPVHGLLLVDRGIHIIEHLNLEGIAADRVTEFLFILAPLKVVGATAAPVRPLAVLGAAAGADRAGPDGAVPGRQDPGGSARGGSGPSHPVPGRPDAGRSDAGRPGSDLPGTGRPGQYPAGAGRPTSRRGGS